MKEELALLTKELLDWNERMLQVFQGRLERTSDFHTEVKPFVEAVDVVADRWKEIAQEWVKIEKPKYMHPILITQAYENIQKASVECFMPGTKQKRFYETHHAIAYVLHNIIQP